MCDIDGTTIWTAVLAIIAFGSFWVQLLFSRWQLRETHESFEKSLNVQREVSRNEIGVNIYLRMLDRFDSDHLVEARVRLAQHFIRHEPDRDIDGEAVFDFFDLGTLLRRGHLDEELAFHAFSAYAEGWWQICSDSGYVGRMRDQDRDPLIYSEFEFFANRMFELDSQKKQRSIAELQMNEEDRDRFLKEEAR